MLLGPFDEPTWTFSGAYADNQLLRGPCTPASGPIVRPMIVDMSQALRPMEPPPRKARRAGSHPFLSSFHLGQSATM